MLYLIGGAPRCGKTALAQRAARKLGVGWLSTDTVRDVVNMLNPALYESGGPGVAPDAEADMFFPYFLRTVESCAYLAESYIVEGVGFMPRHVAMLPDTLGATAVFVGMTRVDLDTVLEHEGRNQWHRHLSPDRLAVLPGWISMWSQQLAAECATHSIPFVDVADDFECGTDEVLRLLLASGA